MRFLEKWFSVRRGFTIIEVVVSVAIIGILTVVVIANLSASRTTATLGADARSLAAVIRETQGYALTGKQKNPNFFPCRYVISKAGNSAYQVTMHSHSGGADKTCGSPDQTDVIGTYSLSPGVVFSSGGFASGLTFTVPFGGVTKTPILLERGGKYHLICVAASGSVTDMPATIATLCP